MNNTLYKFVTGLALLLLTLNVNATSVKELIASDVENYLLKQVYSQLNEAVAPEDIEISINNMDSRITFAPCDQALVLHRNSSQRIPGRALVKVSCTSPTPWSIFVPATVSWHQEVIVSTNNIDRGQIINSSDIKQQRLHITRVTGQLMSDRSQVVGKVATRRIMANKLLDTRYLRTADAVRKGDSVTVIARSGNIAIKVEGIAMANGQKGEQVRVRNNSSQRVVKARIIDIGVVEVIM